MDSYLSAEDLPILERLFAQADRHHQGQLTICKMSDHWRINFEIPIDRDDIEDMCRGKTFRQAAATALSDPAILG
jgi:hypothetical protein